MHFIEQQVVSLRKKYKTEDPFEICSEKKIECRIMNLDSEINGIYQYVERTKYIYINGSLPINEQKYTCYHELGHAVLHETYNCTFLKTCTYFNINKFEKEAEIFAAFFIVPDISTILKFNGLTIREISQELNVPEEYLKLKLEYSFNSGRIKDKWQPYSL